MTVKRIAALFPGQGAYFAGALAELKDVAEVRELTNEIDEVARRLAGEPVSDLLFTTDGPGVGELLRSNPDLLQLAIYGTSVAAYRSLVARGVRPTVLAGHSFGEIAALVCGGAFTVAAGAEIVCHRNAALRAAAEADGYLLAVSADAARTEQILRLVGDPEAVVAAENHDRQTVVAGPRASVDIVQAVATALGSDTAPLHSPYPFHSPILRYAAFDFDRRTRHIPQRGLDTEVYSPILGRAYRDSDPLTTALADHLTRRVGFSGALRTLRAEGVTTFVECGALDALTKITRRVLGAEPRIVPLLLPGSTLSGEIANTTGPQADSVLHQSRDAVRLALTPGLAHEEFDQLWSRSVERIAHFAAGEFAAVANSVRDTEAISDVPAAAPVAVSDADTSGRHSRPAPRRDGESGPDGSTGTAGRPPREALLRELVVIYADALEYPPEVFEENTDLESELGVDSVKQTELLRRVGDTYRLGPMPADFKLGEHNTLGRIADMIATA